MKTLMVVSGGDAPGINRLLAQYTLLAELEGDSVFGAQGGFAGLLEDRISALTSEILTPLSALPGSYLASSRVPALAAADAETAFKARLAAHGVDNLILFGGNGTLRHVAPLLKAWDVAFVGIPTTIDNDVPGTEQTLGFDSACNHAYQAVDGVLATARALPGRLFLLETLGGDTGFLALAVANGAGAHAVLMPEYHYTHHWLAGRLGDAVKREGYGLVVVSEGVKESRELPDILTRLTGIRARDVRLGHGQRGAAPSHLDRTLAASMAHLAFVGLRRGVTSGFALVQNGRLILHDGMLDGFDAPTPDRPLYERINGLDG